jgi:hypothetical protein
MRVEVAEDLECCRRWWAKWDELAVSSARPYCSPAWMLSWWRQVASNDALLRVLFVLADDQLVGVGPFWLDRGDAGFHRYRLLGAGSATRLQPLARTGDEDEVAGALTQNLASLLPRAVAISFEGIESGSVWPRLFSRNWPGSSRPWVHVFRSWPAPTVQLSAQRYEDWFASKSRNFRQQFRRDWRHLSAQGVTIELVKGKATLSDALKSFAALHYARWGPRGGSRALNPRVSECYMIAGSSYLMTQSASACGR